MQIKLVYWKNYFNNEKLHCANTSWMIYYILEYAFFCDEIFAKKLEFPFGIRANNKKRLFKDAINQWGIFVTSFLAINGRRL